MKFSKVSVYLLISIFCVFSTSFGQQTKPEAPVKQVYSYPTKELDGRLKLLSETSFLADYEHKPPEYLKGAFIGAHLINILDLTQCGCPKEQVGIFLNEAFEDSPAMRSGMQKGDIIITFNGFTFTSENTDNNPLAKIKEQLGNFTGGDEVDLVILRKEVIENAEKWIQKDIKLKLGIRAAADLKSAKQNFSLPETSILQQKLEETDVLKDYRRVAFMLERISYTDEGEGWIKENPIPFRNPYVTYCLRNPFASSGVAEIITEELKESVKIKEKKGTSEFVAASDIAGIADVALKYLTEDANKDTARNFAMLDYINSWAKNPLDHLLRFLALKSNEINNALFASDAETQKYIWDVLPKLYGSETEEGEGITNDERKKLQSIIYKIDRKKYYAVLASIPDYFTTERLNKLQKHLEQLPDVQIPEKFREKFTGTFKHFEFTENGLVIVGGTGENVYTEDAAIIVDLGGNDKYSNNCASTTFTSNVGLVIDYSGNDYYEVKNEKGSQGFGKLGAGILIDLEGKDGYHAKNYSQGCGLLGLGILADFAGEDYYESETISQAAAIFGIGILYDKSGIDRYKGAFGVQGFAGCNGFAAIIEADGWDTYEAGGKYPDMRDPTVSYVSMSQGFGFGLRPWGQQVGMSGGIGVLLDVQGEDVYISDYFAQGASYYYALGILRDDVGNDSYRTGRYAQGAGIHYSVGVLLDHQGDDTYSAYLGVAQGMGHDWSVGLLVDFAGNDKYFGGFLVQGAGNACAIGGLLDFAGDDMYEAGGSSQAYGAYATDRVEGSFGVILDFAGVDKYNKPFNQNNILRTFTEEQANKYSLFLDENPK